MNKQRLSHGHEGECGEERKEVALWRRKEKEERSTNKLIDFRERKLKDVKMSFELFAAECLKRLRKFWSVGEKLGGIF